MPELMVSEPPAAPGPAESRDSQDLARFGYKQELARTLGSFSSFAAGFSYISILTGVFQLFWLGFASGGPAFFWTWPLVFAGQFLVALCFAELAAHYPVSGSVYQWSRQIGHRAVGWLAGWVYLACMIVSLAAVPIAVKTPALDILHQCGYVAADRPETGVLLGCLLIGFTTLVNSIGVRLLARTNNVGVFTELVGAALLIVLLAVHSMRGPQVVFDTQDRGAGEPLGYLGAFLAAALMASYVMYGFDTAGTLAEETTEPRKKAPRAILQALAAAALAGGLLMLFALMAVGNPHDPKLGEEPNGLLYGIKTILGGGLTSVFTVAIVVAITVCTLAVHTGTARLMFAMARDNNLPFGTSLARVSPSSRTPVVPVLLAGVLAVAVLMAFAHSDKLYEIVPVVAVLWANLAYLFVTVSLLVCRLRGWPGRADAASRDVFRLGRWGLPVNLLAVAWGVFMVVNIGWPRGDEQAPWYEPYSAVLLTAGLLALGGLYYALVQRFKTGVLPEHRARWSPGNQEGH